MKKQYVKPMIIIDSFSLSSSVAANCGTILGLPSEGNCGLPYYGDQVVFVDGNTGCNYVEADGDFNGLCYDVPVGDNNLFNS